jgi:hypothetical protein
VGTQETPGAQPGVSLVRHIPSKAKMRSFRVSDARRVLQAGVGHRRCYVFGVGCVLNRFCHPERSEGSMASKVISRANPWILHCVQNDRNWACVGFENTPWDRNGRKEAVGRGYFTRLPTGAKKDPGWPRGLEDPMDRNQNLNVFVRKICCDGRMRQAAGVPSGCTVTGIGSSPTPTLDTLSCARQLTRSRRMRRS